jgi:hypothetical protein
MKTIYITESQKNKIAEAEAKVPTAQDQVHGKVNSGLMPIEMEEGAEPESDKYNIGVEEGGDISPYYHVNESEENNELQDSFKQIAEFMKENGLNVVPFPKINLDWSEQDGIFIKTGFYSPDEKAITVFCKDRHPKDILRTFAHEMIHHSQNLNGVDLNFDTTKVKDNKELEKVEAEAYLKGNIYFRKWTEYATANKPLNESKFIEDTNPDDVDLSSFNIKRELNPKFWKNNLLDSRIRLKLLDIADDFIEFLGVDWVKPDDIIMTGSLANFNWSKKYSDIDLHVLMDFSKVDKRTDFVKKYFDSLKNLWNEEHEGLTIFGFPVEVYVQDTNETHASSGVYSLDKNAWLTEPIRDKLAKAKVNKHLIRTKVAKYIDSIDNLIDLYKKNKKDSHKVEKISLMAKRLFDNIKNERRNELNKGHSEISNGNIVFKCLRRIGYIDKIYKLKTKAYDNLNSLP